MTATYWLDFVSRLWIAWRQAIPSRSVVDTTMQIEHTGKNELTIVYTIKARPPTKVVAIRGPKGAA